MKVHASGIRRILRFVAGVIAITTRTRRGEAADRSVEIAITDRGPGITPEVRENLFVPFFTTRAQGTGLGLWVVAQLVRAQSAEIELDSTPGKGTTVRVVWPVHA